MYYKIIRFINWIKSSYQTLQIFLTNFGTKKEHTYSENQNKYEREKEYSYSNEEQTSQEQKEEKDSKSYESSNSSYSKRHY